jgi:hypothetical protein
VIFSLLFDGPQHAAAERRAAGKALLALFAQKSTKLQLSCHF